MTPDRLEIVLDQLPVKLNKVAPVRLGSYAEGMTELKAIEHTVEGMMLQLRSSVLGARILSDRQDFSFEYPASWWQHFKRDKAPGWFTRRYPVRMTKRILSVDFTRYDTYPMADVPLPPDEFGYPVRVETFRLIGPRDVREEPSGEPRYRYVSQHALAFMIASELTERTGSWDIAPGLIRQVAGDTLALLKSYGVNPDQLVREDALNRP
jgi:hypothetical protein